MSACKGCGKEIIWGLTKEGTRIPLDPKPPIYSTQVDPSGNSTNLLAFRAHGYMVSHFATCSKANDFSASNKLNKPDRRIE